MCHCPISTSFILILYLNSDGGVMVNVFALGVVDRGFEHRSGQTKDYNIGTCCFSDKHATQRSKRKDGLLGIRIMYPSGATCLSADCCFGELALLKWSSTKHHYLIKI